MFRGRAIFGFVPMAASHIQNRPGRGKHGYWMSFASSSDWLAALNRRQPDGGSWITALKDQGIEGFPVRWVIRKKGSTQPLATMEMTRLEKKSLPPSLFEIPAGYTEAAFAMRGGLTPEQEKALSSMRENMTPEQRRAYEDAMKRYARPTPKP